MSVVSDPRPDRTSVAARRGDAAVLRRIWRLHFWVGLFAAPVLVVLALSGLVILYTQPIHDWLNRDLYVVSQGETTVPLDQQVATAQSQVPPGYALDAVTPPADPQASTRVDFVDTVAPPAESDLLQVFIDPYTGDYLGQQTSLSGVVGFANQMHRMFGNDGPQIALPSLGHLIDPESYPDATLPVGVFNLWLEVTAVWILVLLASGVYLWWPRAIEAAKPLLRVRWGRGGRIRWRDVHALVGVVVAIVLAGYVVSGLTWSRYWGENWRALSSTVAPSLSVDAPSTPVNLGDYDRLGRRIAWSALDDPLVASGTPGAARMSYADIDRIAKDEGMVPGYAIIAPVDEEVDGAPVWGSFTVVNAWPQRLSEQRTLYLDQFTGATITNATAAQDGALARLTSFGIAVHMGHQYGVWTRIMATLACAGILVSVATGFLMWWKRRPAGSAGLPRPASAATRAATPRRATLAVAAVGGVLGVIYPAFGVTLLVVVAMEIVIGRRRARHGGPVGSPATVAGPDGQREPAADDDAPEVPVGHLPAD